MMERFKGQYSTAESLVGVMQRVSPSLARQTIIWNANEMIKDRTAVRVGRGVYGFMDKATFEPKATGDLDELVNAVASAFPYLRVTLWDTSWLNDLMELQPFISMLMVESDAIALEPLFSALRKDGHEAFLKNDINGLERYRQTSQPVILGRLPKAGPVRVLGGNTSIATLEKILVDLCCDRELFGAYQDELVSIFQEATERYAVNYSTIVRYATSRGRKADVVDLLLATDEYNKVKGLLR
jgi:hypothetical protein